MAIELNIKILAIQEPWVISNNSNESCSITNNSNEFRSINHPSFKQLFPNYSTFRPRVLFLIVKNTLQSLELVE